MPFAVRKRKGALRYVEARPCDVRVDEKRWLACEDVKGDNGDHDQKDRAPQGVPVEFLLLAVTVDDRSIVMVKIVGHGIFLSVGGLKSGEEAHEQGEARADQDQGQ